MTNHTIYCSTPGCNRCFIERCEYFSEAQCSAYKIGWRIYPDMRMICPKCYSRNNEPMAFTINCVRSTTGCGSQYALPNLLPDDLREAAMRNGWVDISFGFKNLLCPSCQLKHEPSVGSGILGGVGQKEKPTEKEMSVKEFAVALTNYLADSDYESLRELNYYIRRVMRSEK